jgi:hypothetical protein
MYVFCLDIARFGGLTYQQAINELSDSWPAKDALLMSNSGLNFEQPCVIERMNKPQEADPCWRTMTHLPAVSVLSFC